MLPSVAALALMFERVLSPTGDSRMTLYLRRDATRYNGFALVDLRAWSVTTDSDGMMGISRLSETCLAELTHHLTAAAYYLLRGGRGIRIGTRYLLGESALASNPDSKRVVTTSFSSERSKTRRHLISVKKPGIRTFTSGNSSIFSVPCCFHV